MPDPNTGRRSYDLSLRGEVMARPATLAFSIVLATAHALAVPFVAAWLTATVLWLVAGILFDAAKTIASTLALVPLHAYRLSAMGYRKDMAIYVTKKMTQHLTKKGF